MWGFDIAVDWAEPEPGVIDKILKSFYVFFSVVMHW